MLSKWVTVETAMEQVIDGAEILYGGFGGVGSPLFLIDYLLQKGVQDLTLIGNDAGFPEWGIGRLITKRRVKKLVTTHIGSNPEAGRQMMDGGLDVMFYPQGILAEKIRSGGVGLAGIFVDETQGWETGTQSPIIQVKDNRYRLETAINAQIGLIYAKWADSYGNLIYDKAARNLNPLVAMAADITIVEADEIIPVGEMDPEQIMTPGIFVDYIVKSGGGSG